MKNAVVLLVGTLIYSASSFALESGVYRQMQDSSCFQAVKIVGEEAENQLAIVQAIGSCSGDITLICQSSWCFGQGDSGQAHLLVSLNESSYLYSIDGTTAVYNQLK